MLERLFGTTVKTRFENHVESKLILPRIAALRSKEKELKSKAESYGPKSLDYSKYKIVSRLLCQYDICISEFNSHAALPNHNDETQALIQLIHGLEEQTKNIPYQFYNDLKKNRNSHRLVASSILWGGTLGATYLGASALAFSTIGIGATVLIGGNTINSCIQSITGLDDEMPTSYRMIKELEDTLNTILNKLTKMNGIWDDKINCRK